MDKIVAIPQKIVDWLSTQSELSDITFFTEFPPVMKSVPLKKAIVAVGINEMTITDKFVANDNGVLEKQEYCRTANIRMRLSICVPYSYGGTACHDYFTKIIDALTFRTDLNVDESGCEEIEADRDTSALVCNGWFRLAADFCPAESVDENFTSFMNKDFICSGHISNSEVHVTPEEKAQWSNSLVTGFYIGNGQSSVSFKLEFTPKLVILFCPEMPLTTVNFDGNTANCYLGVASNGYATAGLALTSTGFKTIKSTTNYVSSFFNEAGYTYCYIAFK